MSLSADDGRAARFATLAPDPGEGSWLDVQRRARQLRRRRLVAYAVAATLALVLVGCTTAFGPRVVDFFAAEQSPPHVIDFLGVVRTASTYADSSFPGFDPKQTRRILDEPFAKGTIQLDLTPLRGGGFCLTMRRTSPSTDGDSTDCATPARQRREPVVVQEPDGRVGTGGGRIGKREGGAMSFVGWVTAPRLASLEVRYEDGSSSEIPHFHVSAPIDADVFLFDVPDDHERFPQRAVELRAVAKDGETIATLPIDHSDPDEWTFPRYANHGFPPAADKSRVRVLRFPGTQATIRVAPAKGGVTCFIFHIGGAGSDACLRDAKTRRMFELGPRSFFPGPGAGAGHPVLLWGLVEPEVRRVDLVFQDGTAEVTRPRSGFVLYDIPKRHHAAGTRLLRATLRGSDGRVVRWIAFDPGMRDLYPCDNPRDLGLGPPICP